MVMEAAHYGNLPRKPRIPAVTTNEPVRELVPGPGVGLHHAVPEVELRPLTRYEEVAHVAAI